MRNCKISKQNTLRNGFQIPMVYVCHEKQVLLFAECLWICLMAGRPYNLGKHNCLHQDVGVRQRHHDLRVVPGAVTVTCRGLGDLELTSTPWTYCEIPGDEGVRIRRRSDCPECWLWNSEGRPYLDRGLGKMTTRRATPPPPSNSC